MRLEDHLDLLAEELVPGHADAIRVTAGQVEIAVGVDPAVVARPKAVGHEHLCRRRPRIEIRVERAGAANADLAGRVGTAGRHDRRAVVTAQPHLVARKRATERRRLGGGAREVHHRQADLDDAERLDEGVPEATREPLRDVGAETVGGRDGEPDVGEHRVGRVLREQVVVVRRRVEHRRARAACECEERTRERARRQEDRRPEAQIEQDRDDEVICHRQEP